MMNISFQAVVSGVFQILLMGAFGYFLVKKRMMDESSLNLLAQLLVKFLWPIFMFNQLIRHFSFAQYPNWWIFPLMSFGVTLSAIVVSQVMLLFFRRLACKKEFISLVVFQNSGYLPLALIATMFDAKDAQNLFVYVFLFLIGFDLIMWSLGVWWVTKGKNGEFKLRNFFTPPLVTILVSLGVIALGWQRYVPAVLMKPLEMFGNCVLPLAMITVGGSLAGIKVAQIKAKEMTAVILSKLILLPLLGLAVIKAFHFDFLTGLLIMIETVVPSAVSLSVITRYYNVEEKFINQGLLFTHVVSIITIPLFLILFIHMR